MRVPAILLAIILIAGSLVACNQPKTGKVVGVQVSLGLGDANSDSKIGGTVTVELDNGKEIKASCPIELAPVVLSGKRVTVKPEKGGGWKITGLAE